LSALFSSLDITPREDGGMTIDAPAEAVATLASLIEGMARLLPAGS
jgi:hypothetical protein